MSYKNFKKLCTKLPEDSAKAIKSLFQYPRIFIYRKYFLRPFPLFLQIEPTNKCNLSCITCVRPKTPIEHHEIESFQLIDILEKIPSVKAVKMQGLGEPMMHRDLPGLLEILYDRGMLISTTTNGTLLTSKRLYCEAICDYLSYISVSLDALSPILFERLGRGTKLNEIINGLKLLVEYRGKRKFPLIGINFVAHHFNFIEIEKLYGICTELKLNFVVIVPVENWSTPLDFNYQESFDFITSAREVEVEILKRSRRLRDKLFRKGIFVYLKNRGRGKKIGKCFWPFKGLFISANGDIKPCCIRMGDKYSLGNVFKINQIGKIWNGHHYQELRVAHAKRDPTNKTCGNCPD